MAGSAGAVDGTVPGAPLPPGATEEHLEAGGIRFRYLRGGSGAGAPLLFLHGWPTWAEVWCPVARRLGDEVAWIAPDLPGQGSSGALPGRDRSIPAHRRAIRAFTEQLGLDRLRVVGNSMGGTLAIGLALDRPGVVERLAVLDAAGLTPRLPGRTARMYLPFLLPAFLRAPGPRSVRRLLERAVFRDPARADERWVSAMTRAWAPRERRRGLIGAALALRRADASVAAELPRLTMPTLVASGSDDVQFPWADAMAAARRIPDGRFARIDSAGHFPMVERPEETAQLLRTFLHEG